MAELRAALEARGASEVRTYLQSGNAVLRADTSPQPIVDGALTDLGVACDVVLRTAEQLADLVARNPWPDRTGEPTKLNVGFLSAPGEGSVRGATPDEEVRFDGAEVWLWYGSGQGRSKLALDVGDRVLTVRNWRTVLALAELAG
jgi:uncharacterized protein (DUF1697 family)